MVDQQLCVDSKPVIEIVLIHRRYFPHGIDSVVSEAIGLAVGDLPEVRDGPVIPQLSPVGFLIQDADKVCSMLCLDVQGNFGKVQIGANAAGADGAYSEAVLAMSGTLGCGENLTAQKVSEWVQNVGYGTVIGCNVGTSTGITSNINPDEYVVFTPENIHIIRSNVE